MSDYLKVKEQLKQEIKYSKELEKEIKRLNKELEEYKCLVLIKLDSLRRKEG